MSKCRCAAALALLAVTGLPMAQAGEAGGPAPLAGSQPHAARAAKRHSGELLVKFRAGASERAIAALLAAAGAQAQAFRRPRNLAAAAIDGWHVVRTGRAARLEALRAALLKSPLVEHVEFNFEVRAVTVPNDPDFGMLWGLHNVAQTGGIWDADVDAPEAWDVTTGDPGVVAAVIDTGVAYDHPDLAANMWTNAGEIPANGVDDDGNGYVDDLHGYDFYGNGDADPYDDHGHGTHVAGTIAAASNNGIGVAGVAWQARIMALKFLGANGSGWTSDAIEAILYAADMGAKVTNNSWGGGGFSRALEDAIATSDQAGALFVAAAGNSVSDNDIAPHYPSNHDVANVLAVAATRHDDALAYFSNYGTATVDLGAPGDEIHSTVPASGHWCCSDPSGYMMLSGTSMAAPHVTGAAVLVFARFPGMSHLQVKQRLMGAADPVPALAGRTASGGRLNAAGALEVDTTPPDALTDVSVVGASAFAAHVEWTATGDDGLSGPAAGYDLRYATFPIDAANFDAATRATGLPRPRAPGTRETVKVRGLEAQTLYYIAVKALDSTGNAGAISNVVTTTTPAAGLIFADDFESGAGNWHVDGTDGAGGPALWHLSAHRAASPTTAFYYGRESTLSYDTGARNSGTITAGPIDLRASTETRLVFEHFLQTEELLGYDTARVQVSSDGSTWNDVYANAYGTHGQRIRQTVDLSAHDGEIIRLRFAFDTWDATSNHYEGWVVDDVALYGTLENDTTPPAAVSDLAPAQRGATYVDLTWTATGDDAHAGGPARTYDLRVAEAPIDESNFDQAYPTGESLEPAAPGTTQAFRVSGLTPGTGYFFALRVADNLGNWSGVSNVASAATRPATLGAVFHDDMESGPGRWSIEGDDGAGGPALWHLATHRAASPTTAFYYGLDGPRNYDTGARNFGSITTYAIDLYDIEAARLSFRHLLRTESMWGKDVARVQISEDGGLAWTDLYASSYGTWDEEFALGEFDLSAYDGKVVQIRFVFDSVDADFNDHEGWFVDDVQITGWIPANLPPVAQPGGPYDGQRGQDIAFDGSQSSDPEGRPLTYSWTFGDGSTASGVAPAHAYAAVGTYTVTLTVSDGVNSASATTTAAVANRGPTANPGGPYDAQRNVALRLDGSGSFDPDGDPLSYQWDFGDGTTGTGMAPSHTYTQQGTYAIRLTVSDGAASSPAATTTVGVANIAPVARPGGPYGASKKQPVTFDGSASSDANGDALSYRWGFGDGTTGSGAAPTHVYASGGSYTVTLTVNDGQADSATASVVVPVGNGLPRAAAGGPYAAQRNVAVTLDGSASSDPDGDALAYRWDFGDGTTGTGARPAHTYTQQGTFAVSLVVNDGETDSAPTATSVSVGNVGPVADAGGPYGAQKRRGVGFDASASSDANGDALSYAWDFGDGTTGTGVNPAHAYTRSGTYTVSVTVSDGQADATAHAAVSVTNTPPSAVLAGPHTLYRNDAVTLDGTGSADADGDVLTFEWTFGDGTGAAGTAPTQVHVYASLGTFTARLTATDDENSSASAATSVTVRNRPPRADAGPDATVKEEAIVSLDGRGSHDADGNLVSHAWRQVSGPAVALIDADRPVARFLAPIVTGDAATLVFELSVADNDGETAIDGVTVTVLRRL